MRKLETRIAHRSRLLSVVAIGSALAVPLIGFAQAAPADHSAHSPATAPGDKSMADQVLELRAKVSELEKAMQTKQTGMGGSPGKTQPMGGPAKDTVAAMPGMGAGSDSGGRGMGMMDMKKTEMPGMSGGGSPMPAPDKSGGGMGMMDDKMEMAGMMGMGSMGSGAAMPQSTLPGFPGASHLYHMGSTGFFLDHTEHITLTTQQQTALNTAKEKAMLDNASAQREIDGAEQELWTLTGSDQPDAEKIEAKVREVEKLRGDQRLGFIRAVGEAAKVLTEEQRKSLLGQLPPQNQRAQPATGGDTSGGGMKDM